MAIIQNIRSSSISTWKLCQGKWIIEYGVGLKGKTNKPASIGSATHKLLELAARKKLAQQRGEKSWIDDVLGELTPSTCTYNKIKEPVLDYYSEECGGFTPWDRSQALKHFWTVLKFNNGQYSPTKNKIFAVEEYFQFKIEEEWGRYRYELPNGEVIEGQLEIKGTIDTIYDHGNNVIEIADWKTGRRKCWATGEIKEYSDLLDDFQILLYFWVASRLYSDKTVLFTIFFIKDGGPFSLYLDDKDIQRAEDTIKKYFQEIKNAKTFNWTKYNDYKDPCRFCDFNKSEYRDGMNACDYFEKQTQLISPEELFITHADRTALSTYTGGGRHDIETKENPK